MARKILIPTLLLFTWLMTFGQNADVELWLSGNIHKDFKKNFRLYYEMGYRRDENLTGLKTFYFEGGGFYKPWKFLWIGPYYRYYDDFKGSSKSHLTGVLLLREDIGRFTVRAKTRYIAEFEEGKDPKHFLRERLGAMYDIPDFKFNHFIATEFIFHMQPDKTQNEQIRFDTGFERSFGIHHSVDIWYRYCIRRNVNNPVNSHIIGIDYIFEF